MDDGQRRLQLVRSVQGKFANARERLIKPFSHCIEDLCKPIQLISVSAARQRFPEIMLVHLFDGATKSSDWRHCFAHEQPASTQAHCERRQTAPRENS